MRKNFPEMIRTRMDGRYRKILLGWEKNRGKRAATVKLVNENAVSKLELVSANTRYLYFP